MENIGGSDGGLGEVEHIVNVPMESFNARLERVISGEHALSYKVV